MNSKIAIKILILLIVTVILFHGAILTKIIPYEVSWGGILSNDEEMYVFESISILINLFLGFILLIKGDYVLRFLPTRVVDLILWIFLFIFGLNTIGNIFAESLFEKSLSLITLIFTCLIWAILKKDEKHTQ